jgi:hypothetical protein
MKIRHVVAAALVLAGVWLNLWGDNGAPAGLAEAVSRPANAATDARAERAPPREAMVFAIKARSELIGDGNGPIEALFGAHSWAPPPPPPPPPAPVVVKAPPKPTAPPLPFTYIGKKEEGGRWEVYLARGADTFIVRDKTQIDDAYRAERIAPPNLTITYLPLKQVQTLIIGDAE